MTEPIKPLNPSFSSGPTAKFKGWSLSELNNSLIGRSHRSSYGKLIHQIFNGLTINTPSLLLVEDWLSIIKWAVSNDGMENFISYLEENNVASM